MSRYDKKEGFIIATKMSQDILDYESEYFDLLVEEQAKQIVKDMALAKQIKRLCFIKLFVFPIEYPLFVLLLGKKYAKVKVDEAKISLLFLRKKLTLEEFNQKHNEMVIKAIK